MKIRQSIAVIGAAASLFAVSVNADDFNTVINVNQAGETSVNINQAHVNPKVTIQDYIDAANESVKQQSNPVADNSSRWNAEKTL